MSSCSETKTSHWICMLNVRTWNSWRSYAYWMVWQEQSCSQLLVVVKRDHGLVTVARNPFWSLLDFFSYICTKHVSCLVVNFWHVLNILSLYFVLFFKSSAMHCIFLKLCWTAHNCIIGSHLLLFCLCVCVIMYSTINTKVKFVNTLLIVWFTAKQQKKGK